MFCTCMQHWQQQPKDSLCEVHLVHSLWVQVVMVNNDDTAHAMMLCKTQKQRHVLLN